MTRPRNSDREHATHMVFEAVYAERKRLLQKAGPGREPIVDIPHITFQVQRAAKVLMEGLSDFSERAVADITLIHQLALREEEERACLEAVRRVQSEQARLKEEPKKPIWFHSKEQTRIKARADFFASFRGFLEPFEEIIQQRRKELAAARSELVSLQRELSGSAPILKQLRADIVAAQRVSQELRDQLDRIGRGMLMVDAGEEKAIQRQLEVSDTLIVEKERIAAGIRERDKAQNERADILRSQIAGLEKWLLKNELRMDGNFLPKIEAAISRLESKQTGGGFSKFKSAVASTLPVASSRPEPAQSGNVFSKLTSAVGSTVASVASYMSSSPEYPDLEFGLSELRTLKSKYDYYQALDAEIEKAQMQKRESDRAAEACRKRMSPLQCAYEEARARKQETRDALDRELQRDLMLDGLIPEQNIFTNQLGQFDEAMNALMALQTDPDVAEEAKRRVQEINREYGELFRAYGKKLADISHAYKIGWCPQSQYYQTVGLARQNLARQLRTLTNPEAKANQPIKVNPEAFSRLSAVHKAVTILLCCIVIGLPYGGYRLYKSCQTPKSLSRLKRAQEKSVDPENRRVIQPGAGG